MAHKKIGRISSESVFKGSGKYWDEWIALLEKAGARSWPRREIVAYLKKKHKLKPWWQQGVTHGFEVAIGRRVDGQDAKGRYTVTATKAIAADVKAIWKLFVSERGVRAWLNPLFEVEVALGVQFETEDGFFGEFRTLKKERALRMSWIDPNWTGAGSYVQFGLVKRPAGKSSILYFSHGQIPDLKTQALLRKRWKQAVKNLSELFAG